MNRLKQDYDYVVLDSPPVGLVSDGYTLCEFADLTLFIVRFNYSVKDNVNFLNDLVIQKKMPNVALVANDIDSSKLYYSYEQSSLYDYRDLGRETYGKEVAVKGKVRKITKRTLAVDMFS